MKIRDAQGKTYNAVRFTIQPVPNGGGKVIAIDVIPGAIAGAVGGGGPGGGGPGGFPGGGPAAAGRVALEVEARRGPGEQKGGPSAP